MNVATCSGKLLNQNERIEVCTCQRRMGDGWCTRIHNQMHGKRTRHSETVRLDKNLDSFYLQEIHLPCGHKWLKVKVFKMIYREDSKKRLLVLLYRCQTKETKINWMIRVKQVTI